MPERLDRRSFLAAGAAGVWAGRVRGRQPEGDRGEGGITAETIAHAQKVAGLSFDGPEREMIARTIADAPARYAERRAQALANGLGPAEVFRPMPSGRARGGRGVVWSASDDDALPADPADIAYAPAVVQSWWIRRGLLTSRRLTEIYLERLKRIGPVLECVITLMEDRALAQAERADEEIGRGEWRGPLHGTVWGAKDLLDTAGVATTWGAAPFRDRVPDVDAEVVRRLDEAGAVLVAKLSLGALAMGDVWFGGRTRSPFDPRRGSSGSSAGSASATAAGLVSFALGTETLGSIVSPCMRCGATGLRPTFGRVPRTGAMALCWSLDKIGPICRTVEDCVAVLSAIEGSDAGDPSSVDEPLAFDAGAEVAGLRVGFDPAWFEGRGATDLDRGALEAVRGLGVRLVEVSLPDLPYGSLRTILSVESAAAFEELTLTGRDDLLTRQDRGAWPNLFRSAWFVPGVEVVQARRVRRLACEAMARVFEGVDVLIGPSYAGPMLLVTNATGHPSLTLRVGMRADGQPHGLTLWGDVYDEGTLCAVGRALERRLGVWGVRPQVG